jgi:Arc/MetJ family transcription regulator
MMRTTINVKDDLMEALMKRAMVNSKTKAIELAIKEYLEKQAIEDLIALSGQIRIDLDWEKEEKAELDEYRDHC